MNNEDATQRCGQPECRPGSGLYVDVENLQTDGQQLIKTLIDDWPTTVPNPSQLMLYVRADMVELWRVWATTQFEPLKVVVNGIQHFSMSLSKNSADIAIAVNAMADLLLKRITHVVVLSDDSDFVSLYAAIRDELTRSQVDNYKVPFLWATTDRKNSLSATIRQFLPRDLLHVVAVRHSQTDDSESSEMLTSRPQLIASSPASEIWTEIAQAIVRQIEVGPFRSTDCRELIEKNWPKLSMATASKPAFGIEFKKNIWPVLQSMGVKIANPGEKPIRYEMTEEAKKPLR